MEIGVGADGVEVWVEEDGYLLAEAYSLTPWKGEPQVIVGGTGAAGADWLAGRLLPVSAGSYCVRVASRSPGDELSATRLVLALSAADGRKVDDGTTGDESPDPTIDDVLVTTGNPWQTATKVDDGTTGDESPDPTIDDVLVTTGGELPSAALLETLSASTGKVPFQAASLDASDPLKVDDGTTGDESPDPTIDDVLVTASAPTASASSVAARLDLCETTAGLACAADLPLHKGMTATGGLRRTEVESYTFEVEERATLTLMVEGAASWLVLYDEAGRPVDRMLESDGPREMVRTVSPGRYLVRVGSPDVGDWYSLGVGRIGR